MSLVESREAVLAAMHRGVSPTVEALAEFVEEVNDFLISINDCYEWDAAKESVLDVDGSLDLRKEPAITVKRLRKMAGYSS